MPAAKGSARTPLGPIMVGLDLTDEEEEEVWVSAETGEVIKVIEQIAPHRMSEMSEYENWRPVSKADSLMSM